MALRILLVLAISAVSFTPEVAHSTDFCDARYLTTTSLSSNGYARRANDRYCDGLIAEPNGGQIQIVSATINLPRAEAQSAPRSIKILRSGLPTDLMPSVVHLRGVSLDFAITYQLDASISGDEFTVGNESAMSALALKSENIGWLAEIPAFQGMRVILPVVGLSKGESEVILTVRPALHSVGVNFQVLEGGKILAKGTGSRIGDENPMFEVRIPAGTPAMVGVKVWSTSTAGDIEAAQVFLIRKPSVNP